MPRTSRRLIREKWDMDAFMDVEDTLDDNITNARDGELYLD
jgi:hypothetical protein